MTVAVVLLGAVAALVMAGAVETAFSVWLVLAGWVGGCVATDGRTAAALLDLRSWLLLRRLPRDRDRD